MYQGINETFTRVRRHESIVTNAQQTTCALVQTLPYSERCAFVLATEQCDQSLYLFSYIQFLYCTINPQSVVGMAMGLTLLLLSCAYIFLILGLTADGFFCPSLTVLSQIMHLNENIAGVTLLAFGNGAPDLFTSIAGLNSVSRQVFSDVFGSATFTTLFVAGMVISCFPFNVLAPLYMRDVLFMILNIVYMDYAIKSDNYVTLAEAISLIVIYVLYIVVVIVDTLLVKYAAKKLARFAERNAEEEDKLRALQTEAEITLIPTRISKTFSITSVAPIGEKSRLKTRSVLLFQQFFASIQPTNKFAWQNARWWKKIFIILKAPILLILNFFLPVVDYDAPQMGWTKLLNCMQLVTLPMLMALGIGGFDGVLGVPYAVWTLCATIPFATWLFCVTRIDAAPKYFKFYCIIGSIGSVFTVYAAANELVSILAAIGITTERSNSFLGCTLLAWGNSLGDLVSNFSLARQGYNKMALAACYGGPLFNTLLSCGLIFTYQAANSPDHRVLVGEGTDGENCTVYLIIGLIIILFGVSSTNFVLRKSQGIFMIFVYLVFLLFTLLDELEITHAYGSDHRDEIRLEVEI